ncbi:type IV secretion protein Rhs [Bergeriella denitrificans]|uniref:Type IV secretion protein Rhs n=1 Tax=Bergeriella denitrificans TaxID=494 RepID=A0A378UGP5_BERDE|nr:type IV secretion protein Rhs [Bergeriella denitrificans]STZ75923.1 Uncharacterised protein [Bergeriella denitrificans]
MNKPRGLTAQETAAAKQIFSDGLDYEKIRIYAGIPGLPSLNVAIAPRGRIYFPRHNCPPDFIAAGSSHAMWLIHELTHVWQYRQGYRPWLGGLWLLCTGGYFRRKAYACPPLAQISSFASLNMEQQAEVLAHYYAARYLPPNPHTCRLPDLQAVLAEFLRDPKQPGLLPHYLPACRPRQAV